MHSVYRNLSELHMLNRMVIHDDHSDEQDVQEMRDEFPGMELKQATERGLPNAMRNVISGARSKHLLYWQDDFVLDRADKFIERCRWIMSKHPDVKLVLLDFVVGEEHQDDLSRQYYLRRYDLETAKRYDDVQGFRRDLGMPRWPGFSLNPGLHDVAALQSLDYQVRPRHEWNFAKQYYEAGFRVAYLSEKNVRHIGASQSAFDLNETPR